MGNEYQTNNPSDWMAQMLGQVSGSFNQMNQTGLGTMGIQALLESLGLGGSMTPGASHMNSLDSMYQQQGRNRINTSSLMATGGFNDMSNLSGVAKAMATSYVHDRGTFVSQYEQATANSGVMAPLYATGKLGERAQRKLNTLGYSQEDREGLSNRMSNRGENITGFFARAADNYGKTPGDFGTASLGTIGKVAAEMVRTNRSDFDFDEKALKESDPSGLKSKKDALKKNLQEFTKVAEDLKGVLGGDALHTLDALNDAFGVNVSSTFKNQGDVLANQTSNIVQTARLTGTSVSTIMRTAGVAGAAMESIGGSRMGSLMVGTMATQAGQADNLAFIDEGKFRSMQTMRLSGAAESQTARKVAGAYGMWRQGKSFGSESEAREAFNAELMKEAGGDMNNVRNIDVLRKVSGASNAVDLINASYSQRSEKYRTTDTMATTAAYAGQLDALKRDRVGTMESMFSEGRFALDPEKFDAAAFEAADEEGRRKILAGAGVKDSDLMENMIGTARRTLGVLSKGRGYMSDEAYQQAKAGYKNMKETQVQVTARKDIMDSMGVTGHTGLRGIVTKLGEMTDTTYDKKMETNYKKVFAVAMGIGTDDKTLAAFKLNRKFIKDITGKDGDIDETKSNVVEMLKTSQSGVLGKEQQTKLRDYLEKMTTGDSKTAAQAYKDALSIGTETGRRKKFTDKYGDSYKGKDISETTKLRQMALLKAVDDGEASDKEKAKVKATILANGVGDESIKKLLADEDTDLGKRYGVNLAKIGVSSQKDPLAAILDMIKQIFKEMTNGKGVTNNNPAGDVKQKKG